MLLAKTEIEQAALGTVLDSPNRAQKLLTELRVDDFGVGVHANIYSAIETICTRGNRPDITTVHAELAGRVDMPALEAIRQKADRLSWPQFVRELQAHAAARAIFQVCGEAREAVAAGEAADVVLDRTAERLTGIATRRPDKLTSFAEVMPEVMAELERRAANPGATRGLLSGVVGLDDMTNGARPGQLWVVAGDTGTGKTSWVMQTALHSAIHQEASWLAFNLEMTKHELAERALGHCAGQDSQFLRSGVLSQSKLAELHATAEYLRNLPVYLEDQIFDSQDIVSKARAWRARHPNAKGGVIVDYLQLASGPDGTQKRHEEIAGIAKRMKRLAKELGVPVMLLSQLNREGKKAERPPSRHDLRDSGEIEDAADLILLAHRLDPVGVVAESVAVNLIVDKQRGGPTGFAPARFVGKFYKYEDAPSDFPGGFE